MEIHIHHLGPCHLSRRWGISERTLERWRWAGIGPKFIKLSNRILYRLVDIEAFEDSQLCQSIEEGKASPFSRTIKDRNQVNLRGAA